MNSFAVIGQMDVEHHVAIHDLATVDGEASLEGLGVEECVRRLRLPECAQHLGVDPMRVARLRADAVARPLPVILGRRRDPVAVVAAANLMRRFELREALPSQPQAGNRPPRLDAALQRCFPAFGERSSRTGAGK